MGNDNDDGTGGSEFFEPLRDRLQVSPWNAGGGFVEDVDIGILGLRRSNDEALALPTG